MSARDITITLSPWHVELYDKAVAAGTAAKACRYIDLSVPLTDDELGVAKSEYDRLDAERRDAEAMFLDAVGARIDSAREAQPS